MKKIVKKIDSRLYGQRSDVTLLNGFELLDWRLENDDHGVWVWLADCTMPQYVWRKDFCDDLTLEG